MGGKFVDIRGVRMSDLFKLDLVFFRAGFGLEHSNFDMKQSTWM